MLNVVRMAARLAASQLASHCLAAGHRSSRSCCCCYFRCSYLCPCSPQLFTRCTLPLLPKWHVCFLHLMIAEPAACICTPVTHQVCYGGQLPGWPRELSPRSCNTLANCMPSLSHCVPDHSYRRISSMCHAPHRCLLFVATDRLHPRLAWVQAAAAAVLAAVPAAPAVVLQMSFSHGCWPGCDCCTSSLAAARVSQLLLHSAGQPSPLTFSRVMRSMWITHFLRYT